LGNTGLAGDGAPSAFLPLMLSLPVNTSPFAAFSLRQPAPRSSGPVGPFPADWPYGSGSFTWPVYGWISQSYRYDHRAVDIAANLGTPVTAADRGVVIRAGWNDQGYGQFVIIDHNIDYLTLYAHLEQIFVSEGQIVGQGQLLGLVGSTGNSTGPHLHFEIRDFGQRVNPLEVLTR
jgi:murein DD-endopeptidase MepM/ murein hydrolase activator NlpD